MKNIDTTIQRGDIFYADLSPVIGSEQGGIRPVLIVQNDIGNKHSPTTIIAPLTTKFTKAKLPTHVELSTAETNLKADSIVLLEQLRTIDKRRLSTKMGTVAADKIPLINKAISISLELV